MCDVRREALRSRVVYPNVYIPSPESGWSSLSRSKTSSEPNRIVRIIHVNTRFHMVYKTAPMSSSSTTVPIPQTENNQDHLDPYDASHWQNKLMPEGVLAVIRRPRYDDTFDVAAMMRESGYPGPFPLPECVTAVKKRRDMVPLPRNQEVVSVGGYRGYRDYLDFLLRENEQEPQQHDHPCKAETHDSDEKNILHCKESVIISSDSEDTVAHVDHKKRRRKCMLYLSI
ncbi:hypothetical protein KIN20_011619 [Parelaphostrongylus tenuis]|uniref:Uncharacterized protein n=1 Tax=Parelaphostrongylus tenuis TaxID=148309 RepID=A0AAD5QJT9_PARTN|nr:hypothetical protein KIN20_011619 [Parelaphostrongylus tenuis]